MDKDLPSQWKLLFCGEPPECFPTRMSWTHIISFGIFFTLSGASWFSYYKRKSLFPIIPFNLTISKPLLLSSYPTISIPTSFSCPKLFTYSSLFFKLEAIITNLISVVWKLTSYWPKEIYPQIQRICRRARFFTAINPWTKVVKNTNSSSCIKATKAQLTRNNSVFKTTVTSHTSIPCSISHKTHHKLLLLHTHKKKKMLFLSTLSFPSGHLLEWKINMSLVLLSLKVTSLSFNKTESRCFFQKPWDRSQIKDDS